MADGEPRGETQKLSEIVKALHGKLRRELRKANGDHKFVWKKHCEDTKSLEEYASAMCRLAVNHWTRQAPEGRVEWCHKTMSEFFRGGGLERLMGKQRRRLQFAEVESQCCCCFIPEENSMIGSSPAVYSVSDQLLLLDVGSCFNPFSVYSDIQAVPIDLQPADSAVFKCDFLNVDVEEINRSRQNSLSTSIGDQDLPISVSIENSSTSIQGDVSDNEHFLQESKGSSTDGRFTLVCDRETFLPKFRLFIKSPSEKQSKILERYLKPDHEVRTLPAEVFHVVVFSLLLSYFPSAVQRWECCLKAYRLLLTNGLLLIVTPDSSHQNRNAAMVKSWKAAIESMGFVRWKYVKQTHLHCMAFRKVAQCHFYDQNNASPEMLYIPQDFKEEEEEVPIKDSRLQQCCESDDLEIMECFIELPNIEE